MELERVPLGVRALVCALVEDYRASATASGLTLRSEVPAAVPAAVPPIVTDGTRVRQVLGNLLSNAVNYTDAGNVTVRATGGWVAVAVVGTGPAIAAEKQPRLFREFSRLHVGEKPGAGLGLAISQRLAHALGGTITVASEAGHGATFTLWLPTA